MRDFVVAIPSIDPDNRLVELVDALREQGVGRFIVVDDGSPPRSQAAFDALERRGVPVAHHPENLGKGSAIKTAIAQARFVYPDAECLITVDADGQHKPGDVLRVLEASRAHPDALVLGTRDFRGNGVPARSRLGNAFSSFYFKMDTGIACADTQTGLRAIPRSLWQLAMRTPGTRYEFEMNYLAAVAKRGVALEMVPIETVYERGNAGSHFSPLSDSLRIYRQFARFACSSAASSVVDLLAFALLVAILSLETAPLVAAATVLARALSGAVNFGLNRSWSFADGGSRAGDVHAQAVRYGLLFMLQMLASMTLVTMLSFLPVPLVAVKALVDGSLFFISHFIQRNWVFRPQVGSGQPTLLKGEPYAAYTPARGYRAA